MSGEDGCGEVEADNSRSAFRRQRPPNWDLCVRLQFFLLDNEEHLLGR